MKTFTISNEVSGMRLGVYAATSASEALDAMARDAGYASYAACEEATGPMAQRELSVTEVKEDRLNSDPAANTFIELQTLRRDIADAARVFVEKGLSARDNLVTLLNREVRLTEEFHQQAERALLSEGRF